MCIHSKPSLLRLVISTEYQIKNLAQSPSSTYAFVGIEDLKRSSFLRTRRSCCSCCHLNQDSAGENDNRSQICTIGLKNDRLLRRQHRVIGRDYIQREEGREAIIPCL